MSLALLGAQPARAQEPLSYFKNYFVTGDYVVRGVSLWRKGVDGKAVADIPKLGGPDGVPPRADILAAFLYVQTAERVQGSGIDHAAFIGNDLGPFTAFGSFEPGSGTLAKALVPWELAAPPCWSVAYPGGRKLVTYRADVFRFLPIDPLTGKQELNKPQRIVVPDSGRLFGDDDEGSRETTNSTGPRAIGASLVVVYRDPTKAFSAIVMYDGAFTKRAFARMDQPIKGFYQSSLTRPAAKMTHIVGDGRPFLWERVFLGTQLIATNPYISSNGAKWDNPTFANLPLPGDAESTTVTVDRLGLLSDCVSFSAIIFKTTVQDTDTDGLLDRWESSTATIYDPVNQPLPNLQAMGADPRHKDLFIEVGYMSAADGTTYGGVAKPAHTHLPTEEALTMVGEAFKKAPVSNPDGSTGINVHFDVGSSNYQTVPPNPFIIPASEARGGKNTSETFACVDPTTGGIIECLTSTGQQPLPGQYPLYPGTVGWKTGFRFLRDELLGFDRNRKDMFRYLFSAHAVGIPVEACLNADGTADFFCQDTNPLFHVPRTNSGVADFPGGDLLLTLGRFDDTEGRPVGTPFMQASTIMHEWGHNFELTHAGAPQIPREPNCKPNYLSVMNYLFQLRGLLDTLGVPQLDYSGEENPGIDEGFLNDGGPLGTLRFRTGWYAPRRSSYLRARALAATKHCDGSELSLAEETDRAADGGMVRVDAASLEGFEIDWDANGSMDLALSQDINFNGAINTSPTALKAGSNDWANIYLNQLGGRRNVGGFYIDTLGRRAVGPLSLDVGRGDIGRGDIGRGDIGRGDIGRGDIGRGDIGRGDIGRGDIGRGDIGRGDIGRGDIGGGDLDVGGANEPVGELDLETATAASGGANPTPPNGLTACLTIEGECSTEGGDRPVRLDWLAPHMGRVVQYSIYRFQVDPESPFPPGDLPTEPIATVGMPEEGGVPTTYTDSSATAGAIFAYFVIAQFDDESLSGISNFATVTTPTPPPPSGTGTVTDPSGDAVGVGNPDPDLVSATVVIQENFVTLQVRFAPGTFNSSTSVAQFLLDTDQNPATGHPGTDSGCQTDAALIGSEYLVEMGSAFHGSQASIRPYAGTCNAFGPDQPGDKTVTYLSNRMDVTFARSLIGNDDGFLNFKVISFSYLGGSSFTGVVDRMPNTGQAAGVVVPQ